MPRQHQFAFETRPANSQELALAMSYGTETKISSKYHCQVIGTFALGKCGSETDIEKSEYHATPFGVSAAGVVSPYSLYSPFFLFSPISVIVALSPLLSVYLSV